MNSVILTTATRILVPLLMLLAVFLLLRGHNSPGGGFIGGLVAAAALALHGLVHGAASLGRLLRRDPRDIAMVGLILALGAGLAPILVGAAPFTGLWLFPAGLPVGTVLVFDVGVFLVVVGAVLTLIQALEEEA